MIESGCYRGHYQGKGFSRKTGLKQRLAKQHERVKDFRRDLFFKLGALLAQEYDLLVLEDLHPRLNPEERNQEEEASAPRLRFLGVKKNLRVAVFKKRENLARYIRLQHIP